MTQAKRPFVRVTELWVPNADGQKLKLARGQYGELSDFETVSQDLEFAFGEGLPGKAWKDGHPIVMHDLSKPLFLREDAARKVGLTCGVAVPIIKGEETKAVLVLLCGDSEEHLGAIEVWNAPPGEPDMGLSDGYFGTASKFEFQSKHMKFRKGFGLPGLAWESGTPIVMGDLGRTKKFIRRQSAETSGITRGLGIPLGDRDDGTWVLTILSALSTPIAGRFEVWLPSDDGNGLVFNTGICESGADLGGAYEGLSVSKVDSALGRALHDGIPWISTSIEDEDPEVSASCKAAELSRLVAMPVYSGEKLNSVVAWYS